MDILCLYAFATRKKHAILQVVYQKNVTLSPLTETTLSFRPFQSNSIELARKSSVPSVVTYVGLAPTGCGLFKSMVDRCWINVDLQWVFQRFVSILRDVGGGQAGEPDCLPSAFFGISTYSQETCISFLFPEKNLGAYGAAFF